MIDDDQQRQAFCSTEARERSMTELNNLHLVLRGCKPVNLSVMGLVFGIAIGILVSLNASDIKDVTKKKSTRVAVPIAMQSIPDPDPTAPWPRIAWLMSFPNSGTSYTIGLVWTATLNYTASNYGDSNIHNEQGISIPVFEESPEGPFWSKPKNDYPYPNQGYILTKTHCGTRCMDCKPSAYMETQHQFLVDCLSGRHISRDEQGKERNTKGQYKPSLVHKAIHLIRNPFNNAVARFHLHIKHHPGKYKSDRDGFRSFCEYENDKYQRVEEECSLLESHLLSIVRDVPFHAEFIRYVRWHNLAFTTTRNLQIPTLILHYEHYERDFNGTLTVLLNFLRQKMVGRPLEFVSGKTYIDYYSEAEIRDVGLLMKKIAYLETWQNIYHYFDVRGTVRGGGR